MKFTGWYVIKGHEYDIEAESEEEAEKALLELIEVPTGAELTDW